MTTLSHTLIGDRATRNLTLLVSLVFVLVVLTFRNFFFIDPFTSASLAATIQVILFDLGWFSIVFLTPLTQFLSPVSRRKNLYFLVSFSLWPISLLGLHLNLLIYKQDVFLEYLTKYPIFIFTDILTPTLYFLIWSKARPAKVA
jgi:hypothetical protein